MGACIVSTHTPARRIVSCFHLLHVFTVECLLRLVLESSWCWCRLEHTLKLLNFAKGQHKRLGICTAMSSPPTAVLVHESLGYDSSSDFDSSIDSGNDDFDSATSELSYRSTSMAVAGPMVPHGVFKLSHDLVEMIAGEARKRVRKPYLHVIQRAHSPCRERFCRQRRMLAFNWDLTRFTCTQPQMKALDVEALHQTSLRLITGNRSSLTAYLLCLRVPLPGPNRTCNAACWSQSRLGVHKSKTSI